VAQIPGLRLEQLRGFVDRNRFAGGADFEADIDTQHLGHLNGESLASVLFETGHGDGEFIRAGRQLGDGVIAGARRRGLIHGPRSDVTGFEGRTRHHGPRGISDSPGDGAAIALCEGYCCGKKQASRNRT
jgi:hypothetical protein